MSLIIAVETSGVAGADAGECSGRVDAGSSVVTGVLVQTLVDINAAELSGEPATLAHWSTAALLNISTNQTLALYYINQS